MPLKTSAMPTQKPDYISQEDWDSVDSPPLTDEQLARLRPIQEIQEYDPELLARMLKATEELKKIAHPRPKRLPQSLLDAIKTKAKAKGVPFTRYVRMLIEQDLARP